MKKIGIIKETKNQWEARTPLIPEDISRLKNDNSILTVVQPSKIRIFNEQEYKDAGAIISDDLSDCGFIFGIKEILLDSIIENQTYIFFSHTIKGQKFNMPMLKKMMQMKCDIIDYEKIVDSDGKRLIFFGQYAGYAGIIDSLWILGRRLKHEGIQNPFSELKQALGYEDLKSAKAHIREISELIEKQGLDNSIVPLVVGITGYGHVSQGVQEILDLLPIVEIAPHELEKVFNNPFKNSIYKVVFKEKHIVEPVSAQGKFELQDYYDHPEKYRVCFEKYIPYISLLVNAIYWDKRYPRLITKKFIKELYSKEKPPLLKVIGDISCDIEGAIECTVRSTNPGNPVFVFDPFAELAVDGYLGNGPVILAIYNLPCELPKDSSIYFSHVLKKYVPSIVNADYTVAFESLDVPGEIKNAIILYNGELTPQYKYLNRYL